MAELETRLRALGDELAWPETPDLAGDRRAAPRLAGAPRGATAPPASARAGARAARRRRSARRRRAAAARGRRARARSPPRARPPSRRRATTCSSGSACARRGAPRARAAPAARPPASPDLGERVALAEAARRARFAPLLPAGLGPPDAVHVDELGAADADHARLPAAPGLPALRSDGVRAGLLDHADARAGSRASCCARSSGSARTCAPSASTATAGVLFTGADHVYLYLDPAGQIQEDRPVARRRHAGARARRRGRAARGRRRAGGAAAAGRLAARQPGAGAVTSAAPGSTRFQQSASDLQLLLGEVAQEALAHAAQVRRAGARQQLRALVREHGEAAAAVRVAGVAHEQPVALQPVDEAGDARSATAARCRPARPSAAAGRAPSAGRSARRSGSAGARAPRRAPRRAPGRARCGRAACPRQAASSTGVSSLWAGGAWESAVTDIPESIPTN